MSKIEEQVWAPIRYFTCPPIAKSGKVHRKVDNYLWADICQKIWGDVFRHINAEISERAK